MPNTDTSVVTHDELTARLRSLGMGSGLHDEIREVVLKAWAGVILDAFTVLHKDVKAEQTSVTLPSTSEIMRDQPKFYGETVIQINVPSGRIIAADNLGTTPYFDVDQRMSINHGFGMNDWTQQHAEQAQIALAFVGNSCPSITRQTNGSLVVVSLDFDEDTDEEIVVANEAVVATICTDLWWTMLTDYDHWLSHGGPDVDEANAPYGVTKFTVIDVAPGLYQWTNYSNSDGFYRDESGRIEYARLDLIEPAATVAYPVVEAGND